MLIDTQDALESMVARAREHGVVALDTEFVWERTFYPALGLVQVGFGDEVHLLDAPALDLAPLGALLSDPDVVKLFHDAEQDLTILRRATGADPQRIFDTQLAAGFVGLGSAISLQGLLQETLGVQLSKGAQRSNWLQRPLTKEQTTYAAADVSHLEAAYDRLRADLEARGRLDWAADEMAQYNDPSRYAEDDPEERYQAVKGRGKRGFSGRQYAVLRAVTAWREREARHRDRPRGHIVPDDALVEIAQRAPQSEQKLGSLRSLSKNAASRYGEALVSAVNQALDTDPASWPNPPRGRRDDDAFGPRLDLVQAFIKGRAQREAVDPALIATRADVEALLRDGKRSTERHALLRGWRYEFVGADVVALLDRRAAVALDTDGLPLMHPLT